MTTDLPPVPARGSAVRSTLARALPAVVVVGATYGAAAWYSPLAPLSVALPWIAGAILGWWIVHLAIVRTVVRGFDVVAIALVAALVAVYFAWVANVSVRIPQWFPWTFDPRLLASFAEAELEHGGVQVENMQQVTTYRGGQLFTIWLAEAAALIVSATLVGKKAFEHQAPAVCQGCGGWQAIHYGFVRRGVPHDLEQFSLQAASGDENCLSDLPPGTVDDDPHVRIDIQWCPRCQDACRTSVVVVSYTREPGETWLLRNVEWPFAVLAELADSNDSIDADARAENSDHSPDEPAGE